MEDETGAAAEAMAMISDGAVVVSVGVVQVLARSRVHSQVLSLAPSLDSLQTDSLSTAALVALHKLARLHLPPVRHSSLPRAVLPARADRGAFEIR